MTAEFTNWSIPGFAEQLIGFRQPTPSTSKEKGKSPFRWAKEFFAPETSSTEEDFEYRQDFSSLNQAILASYSLLLLEDDWDGEGSVGYTLETWRRAATFLLAEATAFWELTEQNIPIPGIQPGPDGSIDLHWLLGKTELLINVPADADEAISFYGDNSRGQKVKGSINANASNQWLMMWLNQ